MVIPVGPPGGYQVLWKLVKQPDGELKAYNYGGVAFVPLTGAGVQQHRMQGYRARIRNHGHSCFLCEIVIRSQFHTTYEPEA